MDDLLQKYNDYIRLKNCRAEYLLSNGLIIEFTYKEENFIHLLGLHKLTDIQLIQLFNDKSNKKVQTKYIISRIKKNNFTDAMVKASVFYPDIESRYESFSYENLTTLTYTNAVINFNPSLIKSKIKSDYLLFEERTNGGYNHLGIAEDSITKNSVNELSCSVGSTSALFTCPTKSEETSKSILPYQSRAALSFTCKSTR